MNVGLADVDYFLRHFMAKVGFPLGVLITQFPWPLTLLYTVFMCHWLRRLNWSVYTLLTRSCWSRLIGWFYFSVSFFRHRFVCVLPCSLNSMLIRLQTQRVLPILCFSLRWSLFYNIRDHCSVWRPQNVQAVACLQTAPSPSQRLIGIKVHKWRYHR